MKVAADQECLRQTFRFGLNRIADRDAEFAAVAQQAVKVGDVGWSGDQQDISNPGQHERGQRIKYHRLVVNRQQMLVHARVTG